MRYNNDGVRVGVLDGARGTRTNRRPHLLHLEIKTAAAAPTTSTSIVRRPASRMALFPREAAATDVGNDRISDDDDDSEVRIRTTAPGSSLKVLLLGYVRELAWFCTRFDHFLFLFVFQLLYER